KQASSAWLILSSGDILFFTGHPDEIAKKTVLRFAVASDGHYGQKDTEYDKYFSEIVEYINKSHEQNPFDFCVINGDIIHDDKKLFSDAKKALDKLAVKYYVSQGNHDHATAEEWQNSWNMPVNYDFSIKKNTILIGTTSNESGTYLCPDLNWFTQKLEEHKKQKNVFIFIHINPGKQTKHAVDCPEFFDLLSKYKNVRAIFNGHDHDQDDVKMKNNIPFIFDAHFGGNWGTSYKGFRIVELKKDNSILTYILNPSDKLNEQILNT
ncbi:MAG TPA: metallophosphoesterase, partial [Chitinophagaceae bacterium]|nr:metallophosphoesterase [Chitinophagaceae bacterium]